MLVKLKINKKQIPVTCFIRVGGVNELVRLGHGVRNLHTPWLGLINCDTQAHTYNWFPFRRL